MVCLLHGLENVPDPGSSPMSPILDDWVWIELPGNVAEPRGPKQTTFLNAWLLALEAKSVKPRVPLSHGCLQGDVSKKPYFLVACLVV